LRDKNLIISHFVKDIRKKLQLLFFAGSNAFNDNKKDLTRSQVFFMNGLALN